MKFLAKILVFFDKHPWDWLAHIILGFVIYILNLSALRVIDFCSYSLAMDIDFIFRIAGFASLNFVIAVELTQWDVFGISRSIVIDSVVDLLSDLAGIGAAILFILIVN